MSDSLAVLPDQTVRHADGRVDLADESLIADSPLYNHDLAPVPVARRDWSTWNYAALWMSMSACIPTYMLAAGLIASGMNWWQALMTVLVGNLIVLIPILLNSHPGTKYGIPFPVFARASYGTIGSNLPALMRAVVACGWFGIQSWIGGEALYTALKAVAPAVAQASLIAGFPLAQWFCFAAFWALQIFIIFKGMELLKRVQSLAAPFVLIMTILLAAWAVNQAHGIGYLLHEKGKFETLHEFLPVFVPSLTAMIGFWATLSLNMPDFTRFGRSQRQQTIGQVVALPSAMTAFAALGVIITSAAVVIYPGVPMSQLWNPMKLIGRFDQPIVVAIAMFTIAVATLTVNTAANVVSPANDFANAFPRWISFKTGGLLTGVIGVLMQPWILVADPKGYIFLWLQGYSGGLGAIAGVMIVDYWLLRRKHLQLPALYLAEGQYTFSHGWNWRAILATVLGCFFAWVGLVFSPLKPLYDYAWFVGFAVAAVTHYILMEAVPPRMVPVGEASAA
jgi:NCS1 family nucleobase:cation symporter-1